MSGKKIADISGKRFGRLVAIEHVYTKSHNAYWSFMCDCGNIKIIPAHSVKSGNSTSCGCYQTEVTIKRLTRHNKFGTREYNIWAAIKRRCYNLNDKEYKNYGERGITICDKWLTFEGFWEDMQEGYSVELTIDRINVNGNYEKSNCRWATNEEQSNNMRSNLYHTHNGITLTISQWGKLLDIPHDRIRSRLKYGWTFEEAITKPVRQMRNNVKHYK